MTHVQITGRERDVFTDKSHPGSGDGTHGAIKKEIYFFLGFTHGFQGGNCRPDGNTTEGGHVGILTDFLQNRNRVSSADANRYFGIVQHVDRVLHDLADVARGDVTFYNLLQSPQSFLDLFLIFDSSLLALLCSCRHDKYDISG
jgi:hypothetical protein